MKKTLMVLSFALCASFAFAQSNSVRFDRASANMADQSRQVKAEVSETSAGYTGSIFTKEGDTWFTCSFGPNDEGTLYTTGIVSTTTEQVDGTAIPRHTISTPLGYDRWQRIPDSAYLDNEAFINRYPNICNTSFRNTIRNYFTPETRDNGFMLMSMIDNYGGSGWYGDNAVGCYDGWIRFAPVDLTNCELGMMSVYQMYRAFNNDATYLDYSVNGGNTWKTIEYNVHGVDIAGNSTIRGTKRLTLPRSLSGQSSVTFRIRYVDMSDNNNGGYFYLVDDFAIIDAPDNHLRVTSCQYFEGFYQMMPKDLQVPVVWASDFYNDGNLAQTNAKGRIYAMEQGEEATLLAEKSLGTVVAVSDSNRTFVIDPLGYYDSACDEHNSAHGWTYIPDSVLRTGPYACLPTANTGANYFFSDYYTDFYTNHVYDTLGTFDTLIYDVNWGTITDNAGQTHPAGIWARDHGVLTYNGDGSNGAGNYFTPGRVSAVENVWSDDFNNTLWNKADYGNLVNYVTGRNVPAGWRILGVEMVAATVPGMEGVGATLIPYLWQDSIEDNELYGWKTPDEGTGVSTYVIKPSDVNTGFTNGYRTVAQGYNTIRILFPNQPRLDTMRVYKVGYRLAEDADFAVAETRTNFYRGTESVSFASEPGMEDYKSVLVKQRGDGNVYSVMTYDPRASNGNGGWAWYNTQTYPMIRMIVGPYYHVNKFKVSWECDDEAMGVFATLNTDLLCGESDSIAEGYGTSFYIIPELGYVIDKITINGVETDAYQIAEDGDGNEYGIMEVESVTSEMVFRCYFKEKPVGFDPVANHVSMKLQPNPATSNVFVSLKGVSGNVNMALLDMSGRVVTTSQFNAENGANINVSNLAKGAYFVRITNNNFTKIEKLIVR